MKTLILISSKYGATENCGNLIKKDIKGEADIINIKEKTPNNISSYDTVIIGSGIYAGNIQGDMKKFIQENEETLKEKNIGIFLCCKEKGDTVKEYIKNNIPNSIAEKAFIKEHAGFEITLERMNFVIRTMMKTIFKVKKNESALDKEAIKRIVNKTNGLDVVNG